MTPDALTQLVQSLRTIHIKGRYVHCDIRPSNVVVADSEIVLVDWACAEQIDEVQQWAGSIETIDTATLNNMIAGKPVKRTAAIDLHCLLCTCLLIVLPPSAQNMASQLTSAPAYRNRLGSLWRYIFNITGTKRAVDLAKACDYDGLLSQLISICERASEFESLAL